MSRCISRRNQREARALGHDRWLADCAADVAREAARARLALRIRELSVKLRGGDYPGRRQDLEEVARLWIEIR